MNRPFSRGITLALITALISGFAVFINKFGVGFWDNASVYTTAKNIIAAIFLTGLLMLLRKAPELKRLSKNTWLKLILIGFIGGSIPFLLFFKALTMIPAMEAAFIHKTLFLWVVLFSYPFLKERLGVIQIIALGIFFSGIFMFGAPIQWSFGAGSILALTATILWAIENIIAKIVLKQVSAITVGWARMFIGSLFLIIYLAITNDITGIIPYSFSQIGWTLMASAALFGYVVSWYSALKNAPATIVSSILVIAAPITAILDAIFVTQTFPAKVILPAFLMIVGIILISKEFEYYYSKFIRRKGTIYSSN